MHDCRGALYLLPLPEETRPDRHKLAGTCCCRPHGSGSGPDRHRVVGIRIAIDRWPFPVVGETPHLTDPSRSQGDPGALWGAYVLSSLLWGPPRKPASKYPRCSYEPTSGPIWSGPNISANLVSLGSLPWTGGCSCCRSPESVFAPPRSIASPGTVFSLDLSFCFPGSVDFPVAFAPQIQFSPFACSSAP